MGKVPLWGKVNRLELEIREREFRGRIMGQIVGGYLPQMLIASPPAGRYEPGLFTFVLLLQDVPLLRSPRRVQHGIGASESGPSFSTCQDCL
jgi:hypothetical protein